MTLPLNLVISFSDLKKKVELETNELRDKMQFDKKVRGKELNTLRSDRRSAS